MNDEKLKELLTKADIIIKKETEKEDEMEERKLNRCIWLKRIIRAGLLKSPKTRWFGFGEDGCPDCNQKLVSETVSEAIDCVDGMYHIHLYCECCDYEYAKVNQITPAPR